MKAPQPPAPPAQTSTSRTTKQEIKRCDITGYYCMRDETTKCSLHYFFGEERMIPSEVLNNPKQKNIAASREGSTFSQKRQCVRFAISSRSINSSSWQRQQPNNQTTSKLFAKSSSQNSAKVTETKGQGVDISLSE